MEIMYTAKATATGRRNGHVRSDNGVLDIQVRTPESLGGPKGNYLYRVLGFIRFGHLRAQRKTKDIGVRKALGANLGSVLWLFAREYSILLLIAFAIAGPLGWWFMHNYLQEFQYRIALDPGFSWSR